MQFLIMVSFPDGLIPSETFVDPKPFPKASTAIHFAEDYVAFQGAQSAKVYCLATDDETGQLECNPYCTVFSK